MHNFQYDHEIIQATGNAIKSQKGFLSMSICSILYIIVKAIKNCLALVSGAMELALEWIKLVLKCANSDLKLPN
jgi:hypothetical protein